MNARFNSILDRIRGPYFEEEEEDKGYINCDYSETLFAPFPPSVRPNNEQIRIWSRFIIVTFLNCLV